MLVVRSATSCSQHHMMQARIWHVTPSILTNNAAMPVEVLCTTRHNSMEFSFVSFMRTRLLAWLLYTLMSCSTNCISALTGSLVCFLHPMCECCWLAYNACGTCSFDGVASATCLSAAMRSSPHLAMIGKAGLLGSCLSASTMTKRNAKRVSALISLPMSAVVCVCMPVVPYKHATPALSG